MKLGTCTVLHVLIASVVLNIVPCDGRASSRSSSGSVDAVEGTGLGLDQRAAGMSELERVRFAKRGGAVAEFDRRYPQAMWLEKAKRVEGESRCLLERYQVAVDERVLDRELRRMIAETQSAEELNDLFAVLGHNPFLIKECLVRPLVVDRLLRLRVGWDPEIQAGPREQAAGLAAVDDANELESLAGAWAYRQRYHLAELEAETSQVAGGEVVSGGSFASLRAELDSHCRVREHQEDDRAIVLRALADSTSDSIEVVTVAVPKVSVDEWWPRHAERYVGHLPEQLLAPRGGVVPLEVGVTDPAEAQQDAETSIHRDWWQVPKRRLEGRYRSTAVWTGSEMIVWGGRGAAGYGGLYDPATDTWSFTTEVGAPAAREGHTAVWTGTEMIVWGGCLGIKENSSTARYPIVNCFEPLRSGGRYDPVLDRWSATETAGAPPAVVGHTAVWTGSEMIVWGGQRSGETNFGAGYDPANNRWKPIRYIGNVPSARTAHSAIWTGEVMIVWGGFGPIGTGPSGFLADGASYDPTLDSWEPLSSTGSPPSARAQHSAVWTGSEMVIVGGTSLDETAAWEGGRYDPRRHRWSSVAGSWWIGDQVFWTGSELIAWGASPWSGPASFGGRYNTRTDSWTPMATLGAPGPAVGSVSVWTGSELIAWGGEVGDEQFLDSGAIWQPETDSWRPMGGGGEPDTRSYHSAVWTGNEMIVWGGESSHLHGDGARYEPATDTWSTTSMSRACTPRCEHTAVWTGTEMFVWGGLGADGLQDSGCRYDPAGDTWRPMSSVGSPSARRSAAGVWTGSEMIIWGGWLGFGDGNDPEVDGGARYQPETDSWTPMETEGAPACCHSEGLWTGEEMAVLSHGCPMGGDCKVSGGLFTPATGRWRLIPAADVARWYSSEFRAVWSGRDILLWGFGLHGRPELIGFNPPRGSWMTVPWDAEAPSPSRDPSVIWTGSDMIVWGGWWDQSYQYPHQVGGRFNAATRRWVPVTEKGVSVPRWRHTAVWTGTEMLVWGGTGSTGLAVYHVGASSARRPALGIRVHK